MYFNKPAAAISLMALMFSAAMTPVGAHAAISLDRTRVIFPGDQKSVSLTVSNQNQRLPYLAQAWLENEKGEKIQSPLLVLPPVQRIEPGKKSQVKVQSLPQIGTLPQDRESVFWFNLREIPPKSNTPNTLQIALQTRIKLFYRPAAILTSAQSKIAQEAVTLERNGSGYQLINPTPYFITIVGAAKNANAPDVTGFNPVMVAPKSHQDLGVSAEALGPAPVLTWINDYGGRPTLHFTCSGATCVVKPGSEKTVQ